MAGARYECIYKNLLRDVRQFYHRQYDAFVDKIVSPHKYKTAYKYLLFPYFTLQFTIKLFDRGLINSYVQKTKICRN